MKSSADKYCLLINILSKKTFKEKTIFLTPLIVIKCFLYNEDFQNDTLSPSKSSSLKEYFHNTVIPNLKENSSENLLDTLTLEDNNKKYTMAGAITVEFYDITAHPQKQLGNSLSRLNSMAPIPRKIDFYDDPEYNFGYRFNGKSFQDWRLYLIKKEKQVYTFVKFQNGATDQNLLVNKKFDVDFNIGVVNFLSPFFIRMYGDMVALNWGVLSSTEKDYDFKPFKE